MSEFFVIDSIMSTRLNKAVKKFVVIDDQQEIDFYMASYIMDVLCGGQHFLEMNSAWKNGCPPIHVYFLELWDTKHKYIFE